MTMWCSTLGYLVTLILSLLAAPLAAEAQPLANVPRIGWLRGTSPAVNPAVLEAFRHGLREHGWIEGQNIVIEYRWAEGRFERLPDLAAELVRLPVDILVPVASDPAIRAAQHATKYLDTIFCMKWDAIWYTRLNRLTPAT
jgi:hypothetical protein